MRGSFTSAARRLCFCLSILIPGSAARGDTPELPSAAVLPAAFITDSSAVLRARVNPHGSETRFTFLVNGMVVQRYNGFIGNGSHDLDVNFRLYGLKAGIAHSVIVRARNAAGSLDSEPLTFTTAPRPADSPSITMLPSADPMVLRFEVDPQGQSVHVDLRENDAAGIRFGTVSGATPVILERTLDERFGRTPGIVSVRATWATRPEAPFSSGGIVCPSGDRFDFAEDEYAAGPVTADGIAPGVALEAALNNMTSNTDAQLRATVSPWGAATEVEYFLNGKSAGRAYIPAQGGSPRFFTSGLTPGTEYVITAAATNEFGSNDSNSITIRTTGTPPPGNKPPVGSLPLLRLPLLATSITGTIAASDPEGGEVVIQSFTQGLSGAVAIDGWQVTYTPGPLFFGVDEFYVVLADPEGATTSIVGQVLLEGSDPSPASYDLVVIFKTDPPKPAGRLTLDQTQSGRFTGKLVIYGAEYALRGAFNSEGVAILDLDRLGLPPMLVTLTSSSNVENEKYLSVTVDAAELAAIYVAEGAPIGGPAATAEVAGFQYTAILPMRAAETETPQGDGFATGAVSKKGLARFSGRTGDGQPFSFGGRLQRTRKLQVGITVGSSPRDYLQGHLQFSKDLNKTVGGDLSWLSYRTATEHYRKNFTRRLQPMGARYRPGYGLFGETGRAHVAKVQLIGEDAASLGATDLTLQSRGASLGARNSSVAIQVSKRSGLFSGTMNGAEGKRRFTGAVVQPFNRGAGTLMLGGPVGAVEVLPQ